MKIVYAYDRDTGRPIGPITLNESDMSPLEPGVWHIPGNCLEAAPPVPDEGFHVVADSGRWVVRANAMPAQAEPEAAPLAPIVVADAVQRLLDETARVRGYDGILAAISYADEPAVASFQAEGQAFRAWRSRVWESFYGLEAASMSVDEVLAALPAFVDPPKVELGQPPAAPKPAQPARKRKA